MTDNEDRRLDRPNEAISREIPGTLQAVAIGAAVGMVAAFVAVGGTLFVTGYSAAVSLGLGGMSAFWGGLGFGAMLGGAIHLSRHPGQLYGPAAPAAPAETARGITGSLELVADGHGGEAQPDRRVARPSSEVA